MRRRTIGAEGCHVRVRDGIGCLPLAMTTRPAKYAKSEHDGVLWPSSSGRRPRVGAVALAAARDVGDLLKPIELLGPVNSTHCRASTPGQQRKSVVSGQRVSVRVNLGGQRLTK